MEWQRLTGGEVGVAGLGVLVNAMVLAEWNDDSFGWALFAHLVLNGVAVKDAVWLVDWIPSGEAYLAWQLETIRQINQLRVRRRVPERVARH